MPACETDDQLVFNSDNKATLIFGMVKCDPTDKEENITITWSLNALQTKLTLDFIGEETYHVYRLDNQRLIIASTYRGDIFITVFKRN